MRKLLISIENRAAFEADISKYEKSSLKDYHKGNWRKVIISIYGTSNVWLNRWYIFSRQFDSIFPLCKNRIISFTGTLSRIIDDPLITDLIKRKIHVLSYVIHWGRFLHKGTNFISLLLINSFLTEQDIRFLLEWKFRIFWLQWTTSIFNWTIGVVNRWIKCPAIFVHFKTCLILSHSIWPNL